jgi:RNA-directed DNA polymerase
MIGRFFSAPGRAHVRGVLYTLDIPKPQGGVRTLGIPTVVDRLIQQALHQMLQPLFEPAFSDGSYGFRPGRNAHQALRQARQYVAQGKRWVVDIDVTRTTATSTSTSTSAASVQVNACCSA